MYPERLRVSDFRSEEMKPCWFDVDKLPFDDMVRAPI